MFAFLLFLSLALPPWLRSQVLYCIKVVRMDTIASFLTLANGFSFSPFSTMLAISLSDIVFIMLGNILSIPSFFRVFIVKEFEFCQRPSAYLDHVIFILDSTYVMRYAY
jgi:hypothetical protein